MDPTSFANVRYLVAPLILSVRVALERALEGSGLPHHAAEAGRKLQQVIGVNPLDESPVDWAPFVTIPTLTYGVQDDPLTRPSDLETIFDAIGTNDKSMFRIKDTAIRWDG